jgi:hypothetical protein
MRITMLKTWPVAPDGQTVQTWQQGESYDMPDEHAQSMIRDGIASAAAPDETVDGEGDGEADTPKRAKKGPKANKAAAPDETK